MAWLNNQAGQYNVGDPNAPVSMGDLLGSGAKDPSSASNPANNPANPQYNPQHSNAILGQFAQLLGGLGRGSLGKGPGGF